MRLAKQAVYLVVGLALMVADYAVMLAGLAMLAGIVAMHFALYGIGWLVGSMLSSLTQGFDRGDLHPDDVVNGIEYGIKAFHKPVAGFVNGRLGKAWKHAPGDAE